MENKCYRFDQLELKKFEENIYYEYKKKLIISVIILMIFKFYILKMEILFQNYK